jgi:hypothetical protein
MAEMKKLSYLFAALVMAAALFSCEQDESEIILKKSDAGQGTDTETPAVASPSAAGVTPVIIDGANNGGNRTCAEVAKHFGLDEDYFLCGDRIDYDGGAFAGNFPDGVMVDVTHGTYVEFELDGPIVIGDRSYVVGAVIVKGGRAANVYFYPGGSMGDSGLTAPVNASGKAAGLSNLTFCLVEYVPDNPELVIALKTYMAEPLVTEPVTYKRIGWAVSGGLGVDPGPGLHMGYNFYDFDGENEFDLVEADLDNIIGPVGKIEASDYWEEGIHYLEIILTLDDSNMLFDNTYLYVGSFDGYDGLYFEDFPFQAIDDIKYPRVFKINLDDIEL